MSYRLSLIMLLALVVALPAAAQTLAITGARALIAPGNAPIENATILIDNGRITSVRSGGPVPAGMRVLDARGQTVTPGFVNCATQIGLVEVASAQDTRDTAVTGERFGPAFDVSFALNGNSALVALARSDGITRVISYPAPSPVPPFSGLAALARLREGADILDRPRVAMFAVIGGGSWANSAGSRAAQWQTLRESLIEARAPQPRPADEEDALLNRRDAAAVRQVLSGAIPLAIITHRESDIRQAIRLAEEFRIRVVVVGGAEAWRVADALAAARIPVVLDPQMNLPSTFDQLGARQDNAAILARAGVRIGFGIVGGSIGYVYNAGLALREGAGLAVANGLPYDAALRALTTDALAIWGTGAAPGLGADADLVLWDGDPLEPSTNATAVIIEGRVTSIANRQTELLRRYRRPRAP